MSAFVIAVLIVVCAAVSCNVAKNRPKPEPEVDSASVTTAPVTSYEIKGVGVFSQGGTEQVAACETYAFASLMEYLKIDFDVAEFGEKYLVKSPVTYDADYNRYAPDLRTAFAGTLEEGYGIYAPAMVTSINNFLSAKKQSLRATELKGKTLEQLCREYVLKDTPVMIWGNAYMDEPEEYVTWIVNEADENAQTKVGDIFEWPTNEHCLLLIGFDEEHYIFSDSVAGKIASYDKTDSEKCFKQMGSQAIVLK